jgi:hypothetical protein
VYKGYFLAPQAGSYNFEVTSDDGTYIWIDNLNSADATNYNEDNITLNHGQRHVITTKSVNVNLRANYHSYIRILYGNGGDKFTLELKITNPDGSIHNGVGYFFYNNIILDLEGNDEISIGFKNNNNRISLYNDGISLNGNTISNRQWKHLSGTQNKIFHKGNFDLYATSITSSSQFNKFRLFSLNVASVSLSQILYINFDCNYTLSGAGSDVIRLTIDVDGILIAYKQASFLDNKNNSRDGSLLPISGAYSLNEIRNHEITILLDMTDSNDTLSINENTWTVKLEVI